MRGLGATSKGNLGLAGAVAGVFLLAGSAQAVSVSFADLKAGANITIPDGVGTIGGGWYGVQEDNEVEPNCVATQSWDLEGFFFDGRRLTLVGGFDFVKGVGEIEPGDLFLDVGLNGPGGDKTLGYDYAVVFDFPNAQYSAYALSGNSAVRKVLHAQNDKSNPWRYDAGGTKVVDGAPLWIYDDLQGTVFSGNRHYGLALDLSFLEHGTQFTSHYTMECGNDNLMGRGVVAPEPTSMVLLGSGLIGLASLGRRRLRPE